MSKAWHIFIWFVIILGLTLCFYGIHSASAQTTTAFGETDATTGCIVGSSAVSYLTARNATTGTANEHSFFIGTISDYLGNGKYNWYYYRDILNFDTSGLPDNATVQSATVRMDVTANTG